MIDPEAAIIIVGIGQHTHPANDDVIAHQYLVSGKPRSSGTRNLQAHRGCIKS